MIPQTDKRNQRRKTPPLIAAGTLLTLVSLALWGLGCCIGDPNICTLAAALCWGSGIASLVITSRTAHTPSAIPGILGGVLLRMAFPLIGVVIFSQFYNAKQLTYIFGILVAYYLAILFVDTLLTIWLVQIIKPQKSQTEVSPQATLSGVAHG